MHALGYTFLHTIYIENGCTFLPTWGLHVIAFVGGTKGLQLPAVYLRAETGDVHYIYLPTYYLPTYLLTYRAFELT